MSCMIDIAFRKLGDETNAKIDLMERLSDLRRIFTGEQATWLENAINELRTTIHSSMDRLRILLYDFYFSKILSLPTLKFIFYSEQRRQLGSHATSSTNSAPAANASTSDSLASSSVATPSSTIAADAQPTAILSLQLLFVELYINNINLCSDLIVIYFSNYSDRAYFNSESAMSEPE